MKIKNREILNIMNGTIHYTLTYEEFDIVSMLGLEADE